jgi:hypothetical protein
VTLYRENESALKASLGHTDEPYIFVTGVQSVMSQLVQIRADLARGTGGRVHVATHAYHCDSVEGMDRLLSDVRARRISEIRISESQWGVRRLVINYFGA